jgi:hypothetical protein
MGIVELAAINLYYAQAEISTIGDRESIVRSLDHLRQAQAFLVIAVAAYDALPTDAGQVA